MASILIKDTTREQREQIVRESLGDDNKERTEKLTYNSIPKLSMP